ncbi:phosphotransferase [Pseudalgibacter alginicilyticus]|uniref:Phosphotransferase n=1 Tax=Pseudalgibacter alginicilyticus TaxID=1736674 RepID=A0A0P0DAM9_9FLAO|nr:aminoglycoside phosphotransferase family protein [Pseudalgibacter alginicilyticus]ALJ05944.1 phosphotransferase [Pseudalgibacter alginicilyticus]
MLEEKLKNIFEKFEHGSEFYAFKELASGHINDTYLILTKKKPYFVLQRINHGVFKDVPGLINNKVLISQHIKSKLKNQLKKDLDKHVLTFAKTKQDNAYFKDELGNYWNLMYFIDESLTFETVKDEEVAYEGGKLFGEFLNLTDDFDAKKLIEVIPNFHDMSFRYSQFQLALQSSSKERLLQAAECIDFVTELKEEMHILQNLKESGEIKLRVTHNDTKISNALFTKDNKGLCVIDTDTVMPGIVHYDFGDAIRTICNTAAEDEINLDLVEFNLVYYKAYTKGFLEKIKDSLTPLEIKYLPLGAKTMIFIMALRFLTDYLNNDIYYKIKYPEHNLNRAKNQFKLIHSFAKKYDEVYLVDC